MSIKVTYEQVKVSFELEGFALLSDAYISAKTKLDYSCSNEHKHSITWSNFKTGYRCPYCFGNTKPSYDIIKESFEKEGYILLSKEYINAKSYLNFICQKGHNHKITWDAWNRGMRCGKCVSVNNFGIGHPGWRGGISRVKYCPIWNSKEYKNSIKERDGYRCLNPYCSHKDKVLAIHHIDYTKENCNPSNLITICGSCNSRANTDREWHTAWYQAIIKNRYNYGG